jgi:TRAP-type C4-dicarboxylate transport system substrate-binding protein
MTCALIGKAFSKMTVVNNTLGAAVLLAVAGLSGERAVAAETLTLSSWLPPTHPVVVNAIEPWAKQVREATDGNVRVRVLTKPLGSPLVHFDLAKDGVADITYGLHSYTKGDRFVVSNVAQFPFLGDNAEALSVAYWQAHENHLAQANEHEGTHVLSVFTHGPGMLHNSVRPVTSRADLEGLKIRVPGGYGNDVVEALGATPMLIATPELYESLSRGIVDGVTITAEAIASFDLTGSIEYTTTFPGGLYNTSWFLVMNQGSWGELSQEDRDAIMSVSGEAFARLVGKAWDEADAVGWEEIEAAGIEVTPASDAFVAEVEEVADRLESQWTEQAQERGVDGTAVLAEIRETAAQ